MYKKLDNLIMKKLEKKKIINRDNAAPLIDCTEKFMQIILKNYIKISSAKWGEGFFSRKSTVLIFEL